MAERNMQKAMVSDRSMKYRQANIVDMNIETRIPKQTALKKNKNDFYRFLLQANYD